MRDAITENLAPGDIVTYVDPSDPSLERRGAVVLTSRERMTVAPADTIICPLKDTVPGRYAPLPIGALGYARPDLSHTVIIDRWQVMKREDGAQVDEAQMARILRNFLGVTYPSDPNRHAGLWNEGNIRYGQIRWCEVPYMQGGGEVRCPVLCISSPGAEGVGMVVRGTKQKEKRNILHDCWEKSGLDGYFSCDQIRIVPQSAMGPAYGWASRELMHDVAVTLLSNFDTRVYENMLAEHLAQRRPSSAFRPFALT